MGLCYVTDKKKSDVADEKRSEEAQDCPAEFLTMMIGQKRTWRTGERDRELWMRDAYEVLKRRST